MLREALLLLRRSRDNRTMSLQVGLFAFFALFALVLLGAVFLVLSLTGVFNASVLRHNAWLDAQIAYLKNDISGDYERLSLRGVSLARGLSASIHRWTRANGISESEIAAHPALIESLLAEQAGTLISVLENNPCSGIFLILDATVNPAAENAASSRAGIFFRRTEPNTITSIASRIHCLRGPASIARSNGIELIGQWRMEFDISDMDFYEMVMETARQNSAPYSEADLARLYYWSNRSLMSGNSEHCMLLALPLIAPDGTVYGICGIEVSAMLFKRLYSPDNTEYPRVFAAFAPLRDGALDTDSGLVAGNSYLTSQTNGLLAAGRSNEIWHSEFGIAYTGRMETIRLYPALSPFAGEIWALALLMPDSDWKAAVSQSNAVFYSIFITLLAVSLLAAIFISRHYIRPVLSALQNIKTDSGAALRKTHITEIDEFLNYLAALAEERKALAEGSSEASGGTAVGKPVKPVLESEAFDKLSYQELRVAELLLRGHTYTEIAEALKIQPNTVKWYQKSLYSKLQINSKRELFALVEKQGNKG